MVAEEPDLMSVGKHCAECSQLDFLPFYCRDCDHYFCAEHRSTQNHACKSTRASRREVLLVTCERCSQSLRVEPGQDGDEVLARHVQTCSEVPKKTPRCPVASCKQRLTPINNYLCPSCNEHVCVKHRFPEDHSCTGRRRWFRRDEGIPQRVSQGHMHTNVKPHAAREGPAAGCPRRVGGQEEAVAFANTSPERFGTPQGSVSRSQSGASSAEDISGLASTSSGPTRDQIRAYIRARKEDIARSKARLLGGYEGCPWCGRSFPDAVEVVHHAERCGMRPVEAR